MRPSATLRIPACYKRRCFRRGPCGGRAIARYFWRRGCGVRAEAARLPDILGAEAARTPGQGASADDVGNPHLLTHRDTLGLCAVAERVRTSGVLGIGF